MINFGKEAILSHFETRDGLKLPLLVTKVTDQSIVGLVDGSDALVFRRDNGKINKMLTKCSMKDTEPSLIDLEYLESWVTSYQEGSVFDGGVISRRKYETVPDVVFDEKVDPEFCLCKWALDQGILVYDPAIEWSSTDES